MEQLNELMRRLRMLARRRQFDRDLDDEMRLHQELRARKLAAQGTAPEEAPLHARRRFGNPLALREQSRDAWGWLWLDQLFQDLRYGLHTLVKARGFTTAAVLTLALGIGANTAIFSAISVNLLQPLPYSGSDRLTFWWGAGSNQRNTPFSPMMFLEYQARNRAFDYVAAFAGSGVTVTGVDDPERLRVGRVTADFFRVLNLDASLGRTFAANEDKAGNNNVAVLSYGLWQRRFGSDPSIVGRIVFFDTKPTAIIGVLPRDFQFEVPGLFRPAELWMPLVMPTDPVQRNNNYLRVIGRMKPGATVEQAHADLESVTRDLVSTYPQQLAGMDIDIVALQQQVAGRVRPMLLILFGVVGLVLLIACANVANLQLARSSARAKELAIRASLGATRARLIRQLLTESAAVALAGGAAGLFVASSAMSLFAKLDSAALPRGVGRLDAQVLAFSIALSLLTALLFGLAPALSLSVQHLNDSFRERSSSAGEAGGRFRAALTVAEIALSLVLLAGAGLLVRSFDRLSQVQPGFDAPGILTLPLALPRFTYARDQQQAAFYAQLVQRISALPGVRSAGIIDDLPFTADRDSANFIIEGRPPDAPNRLPLSQTRTVTPGYFETMGIPLASGRLFTASDASTSPPVLLVNRSFAAKFFPNEDPIGHRIKFGLPNSTTPWATIVGVVGDVHDLGLDSEAPAETYTPYQQGPVNFGNLVIRSNSDPTTLASSVRNELHAMDPLLPLFQPQGMEKVLALSLRDHRRNMTLLGVFAAVALALAAAGIYGVMRFSVARRTQEIGIRMALGAQRGTVMRMILRQGLGLAALGVALGLAGAPLLVRVLSKFLFGVTATDPLTYVAVSLLLFLVALIACYIPARRATRIDPLIALRYE